MSRRNKAYLSDDEDSCASSDEEESIKPREREQQANTLASEGDVMAKHGHWERAIAQYTTALELKTTPDKNILVARSKCHMALGDSVKALADVDLALQEDKDFYKGLYQKAEALFTSGDFEYALIYYHRGHKLRPDLVDFRLGIQKAQQAIDGSIDTSGAVPARGQAVDSQGTHLAAHAAGQPEGTRQEGWELLGELSLDREFLQGLLGDDSLRQNAEVTKLASDGIKYLGTRKEFWRQQCPPRAPGSETSKSGANQASRSRTNSQSTSGSSGFTRRTSTRGEESRANTNSTRRRTSVRTQSSTGSGNGSTTGKKPGEQTRYVLQSLENINGALDRGEPELGLKFAKNFLTRLSAHDLPDKQKILGNLYHLMGNLYLELNKLPLAAIHHRKDLDIAMEADDSTSYTRALGALGRTYQKMGDHAQAISMWQKKLDVVLAEAAAAGPNGQDDKNDDAGEEDEEGKGSEDAAADEAGWICANVGHSYYCLGDYNKAIRFEERALGYMVSAPEPDQRIVMKSHFIIGNAHFKLGNHTGAVDALKQHIAVAAELGDRESQGQGYLQLYHVYRAAGDSAQAATAEGMARKYGGVAKKGAVKPSGTGTTTRRNSTRKTVTRTSRVRA